MSIAALLIKAKRWKEPKGDEWVNKIWHSHTMEYYP